MRRAEREREREREVLAFSYGKEPASTEPTCVGNNLDA